MASRQIYPKMSTSQSCQVLLTLATVFAHFRSLKTFIWEDTTETQSPERKLLYSLTFFPVLDPIPQQKNSSALKPFSIYLNFPPTRFESFFDLFFHLSSTQPHALSTFISLNPIQPDLAPNPIQPNQIKSTKCHAKHAVVILTPLPPPTPPLPRVFQFHI